MKFKLIEKKDLTESVKTLIFEPPEPVEWQAGQYMHYVLDHTNADDRGIERWFTISNPPYEKHPSITTRFTAKKGSTFKNALKNMEVGDTIKADGVEGDFVLTEPSKQYIFIAGGIGITPFHAILTQLAHDKKPINVDLMYANRDDNFVFGDELRGLQATNPNFKIHEFVDPKKIELADIQAVAKELSDPEYYISGPYPMVDGFAKMLKDSGVAQDKLHTDDFPGYEAI